MSSKYPPEYLEFIRLFNRGAFFESHEILELLWKKSDGRRKRFYQGLIQAAVCLHHFERGNAEGAQYEFRVSREKLEEFLPEQRGMDVRKLLEDLKDCLSGEGPGGPLPKIGFKS